jgi:hypothetical protein
VHHIPRRRIQLLGSALGRLQRALGAVTAIGSLSRAAGGAEVLLDGKPAPDALFGCRPTPEAVCFYPGRRRDLESEDIVPPEIQTFPLESSAILSAKPF